MILDTSILIDLLRGNKETTQKIKAIEQQESLKISTITVMELYAYIGKQKIETMLKNVQICDMTVEIAKQAGLFAQALSKKGQEIDTEDYIIAATAYQFGEPILTKNPKHFSRIKDIKIV